MADINDIKEKVMNTIGSVADMTKDAASRTADAAKGFARITKLSLEINGEKDTIKKAYLEIGKLYYEAHKGDPEGFFTQLCEEITIAADSVKEKEDEIAAIKQNLSEKEGVCVDVEFEEIIENIVCGTPPDEQVRGEEESCGGEEPKQDGECHCGCKEHSQGTREQDCSGCSDDEEVDANAKLKERLFTVISDVLAGAPEKAAEIKTRAAEVLSALPYKAAEAKDKVSDVLGDVLETMPDKASEIKEKAFGAANEVAGAVKDVIEDLTDKKDD